MLLRYCGVDFEHAPHPWAYSSFGDVTEVTCIGIPPEEPLTQPRKWEEAARVCSKLAAESERRELALAAALQEARDMLAEWADEYQPRLLMYVAHLDEILAPYRPKL